MQTRQQQQQQQQPTTTTRTLPVAPAAPPPPVGADAGASRLRSGLAGWLAHLADSDVTVALAPVLRSVASLQHHRLARSRPELRVHLTRVIQDEALLPLGPLGRPPRLGAHLPETKWQPMYVDMLYVMVSIDRAVASQGTMGAWRQGTSRNAG